MLWPVRIDSDLLPESPTTRHARAILVPATDKWAEFGFINRAWCRQSPVPPRVRPLLLGSRVEDILPSVSTVVLASYSQVSGP